MKSRGETERYCPDHMTFIRKPNSSATLPPLPSGLVLGEREVRGGRAGRKGGKEGARGIRVRDTG